MQHISDKQAVENKTDLEFIFQKEKKRKLQSNLTRTLYNEESVNERIQKN